jgi:hypothetical protein
LEIGLVCDEVLESFCPQADRIQVSNVRERYCFIV